MSDKWTFLTSHGHVLLCLHRHSNLTLREVAERVGITERAVQKIVRELESGGYLIKNKMGRRNQYKLKLSKRLRHEMEKDRTVEDFLKLTES